MILHCARLPAEMPQSRTHAANVQVVPYLLETMLTGVGCIVSSWGITSQDKGLFTRCLSRAQTL